MKKFTILAAALLPTAALAATISPLLKGVPSNVAQWKVKIENIQKEKPKWQKADEYPKPFHKPNSYTYRVEDVCTACHTYAAHYKDKKLAPFYNAHSTFMSCTVCHYKANGLSYAWEKIDDDGNIKIVKDTKDCYGVRYVEVGGNTFLSGLDNDARIAPLLNGKPIDIPLKGNEGILHDPRAVSIIYNNLAKKPYTCLDCHNNPNPPLNLKKLGFSKERIQDITNNEIVRGLLQDGKIYFPNFIWNK